ncbi:hypothetical protein NDU88_007417 [Pleurodeles waltl]|uniref:Uncharacterized protein n=1 Tax=Pleurodeles waltl TaxID=8319 RepID=A0AAV7VTI5_PLEWA|nr:hypothetical protein NDU88_007417 [Pleurodeles waltl]
MVRTKGCLMQWTNKMDNYAVARWPGDPGVAGGDGGTRRLGVELDPPCKPLLSEIMATIHDLKGSLEPWLDAVGVVVGLLCADLQKVYDKVSTAETDIVRLQSVSNALEEHVRFFTTEYEPMADQEGRTRKNNIRVVGVPERAKGPSAELFVETLVIDHLCPKRLSSFFKVEWAHRALFPPLRPGAPPRTIIARIFNFRDQDTILQAAHSKRDLQYENVTVCFFPDFKLQVQQQSFWKSRELCGTVN